MLRGLGGSCGPDRSETSIFCCPALEPESRGAGHLMLSIGCVRGWIGFGVFGHDTAPGHVRAVGALAGQPVAQ